MIRCLRWYIAGLLFTATVFVNGLVNAGAAFGAIVAAPLVAYLTVSYGWRVAFVIAGGFGLFWLVGWLALYHLPEKHPRITPVEFALIQEARRQEEEAGLAEHSLPWTDLVKYPQTWGLFLARLFSDPVWWFYLFWPPKYLAEERGFSLAEIGMLAWAPHLGADIGAIVGGLLSGYLIRKGWGVLGARAVAMAPFVVVMPLSLAIPAAGSPAVALGIICLVTFCHMGWRTNLSTVTNDVYPRAVVGTVAGMPAFGSGLGGTVFTGVTGWVVDRSSYRAIFVVMGYLHPGAYVDYRMLVRGPLRRRGQ
jgi:ACS family hexuronate transporter-like MFS transporter